MLIDDSSNTFIVSFSNTNSNLDVGIESETEITNFIYSVIEDELSVLEIIFNNLLTLDLIILTLSVMVFNICL